MALYKSGDRKIRPGVYRQMQNRSSNNSQRSGGGNTTSDIIKVSPEGVIYDQGSTLAVSVKDDGTNVLVFRKDTGIAIRTIGERLSIQNPID